MTLEDTSGKQLEDGTGKLMEGEQAPWTQPQEEFATFGRFRGVKESGDMFMANLRNRPGLRQKIKGMLWMGTFDSPDTAALAHDLAAYSLYGPKAVFNFPVFISEAMGLRSKTSKGGSGEGEQEVEDGPSMPLEQTSKKRMLEDGTHAQPMQKREKKIKPGFNEKELSKCGKFHWVVESGGTFFATIKHPGPREGMFSIGPFKSPETAALAFDIGAYNLHGSQAKFNFEETIIRGSQLRHETRKAKKARGKVTPPSADGQKE